MLDSAIARSRRMIGANGGAVEDLRTPYREFRADSSFGNLRPKSERFRTALREEFRRLGDKLDTHFRWLMALQVTTLLVLGGAVVGLYFK